MISVIMSTYREKPEYIHLAIRSILEQTHRDLELILVPDDPENMPVMDLLREYEARDKRVKVLENARNLGLPGALNKALTAVQGDYIARMDADDISHPERFEVQLQYLREHNLDLVGARKRCIDEAGALIPDSQATYYPPGVVMKRLRLDDCLPHSTWLAKKTVFDRVGGYRDMPRSEDFDFLLRALARGFRMGMCEQVVFDHRINDAGISRSGMLEQMLASWYLTDHFGQIEQITPGEVRAHVREKLTKEDKIRFQRATEYFDRAVRLRRRSLLGCGACLVKCMATSGLYRRKLATILRLKLLTPDRRS